MAEMIAPPAAMAIPETRVVAVQVEPFADDETDEQTDDDPADDSDDHCEFSLARTAWLPPTLGESRADMTARLRAGEKAREFGGTSGGHDQQGNRPGD